MLELTSACNELRIRRFPLIDRQNRIEELGTRISIAIKNEHCFEALRAQISSDGKVDQPSYGFVNDNLELERREKQKYLQEQEQLWGQQRRDHKEFVGLCYEHYWRISELIPPAVFALREELNLPIDQDAYMKMFSENLQKDKVGLDSRLAQVQQLMDHLDA